MTTEHIHGCTIAQNGTVSYEGASGGNKFTCTTYQTRDKFDWSRLPKSCPVLDLDGGDIVTIWREIINHDHPSFSAKCETARKAGFKVTTAGRLTP
jgi:hypothetical protein